MPTSVLALPNTYATGQSLPHADFNTLVDTVEWLGAGYLSLSVAGSSNVTLSAAQYQVSILKLTGVLTGSISVLVPDAVPGRRWVVYNATSGSFTVTVKPVSGTGVLVTQGAITYLWTDGTNILSAITDLPGPTLSGTVTLAEAANVAAGTTTGSKIGTSVSQKVGFWNVTPVVQPANANQAVVTLGNTDNEIGGLTISAAYSQAEVQAFLAKSEELADDVRALSVLLHSIRTALVNTGIMKGAA